MTIAVAVKRLPHGADLPLPDYATIGAAGIDLLAAVSTDTEVAPGARALIPTGIAIALPTSFELQIRPRSGLALKYGLIIANSPGTIDADYRGEIKIIVLNASTEGFVITRGMRVAQAVLAPVLRIAWHETEDLDFTCRGSGGFGSTGLNERSPDSSVES